MKIQENDLLWKWYLRFYKYEKEIPEPKSLCPYFWCAMGGLLKVFFIDIALYITLPLAVVCLIGYVNLLNIMKIENSFLIIPGALIGVLMLACVIGLPFAKIMNWIEQSQKRMEWFARIAVVLFVVVCIIACIKADWNKDADWKGFWEGMLLLGGIGLGTIVLTILYYLVICPTSTTRFGQQLIAFFKSIKRGVCPMVDPPDSFKDRWKNMGDG